MKKNLVILLIAMGCAMIIAGCAGSSKVAIQKKLMAMSDRELIEHYQMIEMRMVDLDRAQEQSIQKNEEMANPNYDARYYNSLQNLHIGDTWSELRKEKDLAIRELSRRGLSPPRLDLPAAAQ